MTKRAPITVLAVTEPMAVTQEDVDRWTREWINLTLDKLEASRHLLTLEQRARLRKLLSRKADRKNGRGRPAKNLSTLPAYYTALREAGFKRAEALPLLMRIYGCSESTVTKRLTAANIAKKTSRSSN